LHGRFAHEAEGEEVTEPPRPHRTEVFDAGNTHGVSPAQLADAILKAAGSGLRHYTEYNRERICAEAARIIEQIKGER
jgi:hypothetical protein